MISKRSCTWIALMLCAALLYPLPAAARSSAQVQAEPLVDLNGEELFLAPAPFIKNNYTLAPAGPLFRALGYAVWQDAEGRTAVGEKAGVSIQFTEGEKAASLRDGGMEKQVQLPAAPVTRNRTLYVPLRALSEMDGRMAVWHENLRRVSIIDTEGASAPQPPVDEAQTAGEAPTVGEVPTVSLLSESEAGLTGEVYGAAALENLAGVRLDWMAVPPVNYVQKMNLIIASGDTPDILYLKQPAGYNPDFPQAFFRDLPEALTVGGYPNLKAALETHAQGARTPDGFVFGIPRETPVEQLRFPFIRKDWLDVLGLAMPSNADELMIVLDMFTNYDPDGNGKHDTIGIAGSWERTGDLGRLAWVERLFTGTAGRFAAGADGNVVDTLLEAETREALLWLNEAYKRRYVDAEFPVKTAEQMLQTVAEGRAGIAELTLREAYELNQSFESAGSAARLVPLLGLKNAAGKPLLPGNARYTGVWTIPRSVTDDRLPGVLAVLEAMHAPEYAAEAAANDDAGGWAAYMGWNPPRDAWFHRDANDGNADVDLDRFAELVEQWKTEAPVWDGSLPGWLDREQKEALLSWNDKIGETKIKLILGGSAVSAWDELAEAIRSDPAYQEVMAAVQ